LSRTAVGITDVPPGITRPDTRRDAGNKTVVIPPRPPVQIEDTPIDNPQREQLRPRDLIAIDGRTPATPQPVIPPTGRKDKPIDISPDAATGQPQDVFFDFDKSGLREDQKAALNADVAWLKRNQKVRVTIEGHCDERGANEYNLALGERRAKAVKDYLVAAGIAADRIATVSYGEERPFVLGHDESAWTWNRRGHVVPAQ
jgi:peptidoglycan-associated lipoprotein